MTNQSNFHNVLDDAQCLTYDLVHHVHVVNSVLDQTGYNRSNESVQSFCQFCLVKHPSIKANILEYEYVTREHQMWQLCTYLMHYSPQNFHVATELLPDNSLKQMCISSRPRAVCQLFCGEAA